MLLYPARRLIWVVVVATALFLALFGFYSDRLSPLSSQDASLAAPHAVAPIQPPSPPTSQSSSSSPPPSSTLRQSPWRNITLRHPIPSQDLISLPRGAAKELRRVQHAFEDDAEESVSERRVRLERQATVKVAFSKGFTSYKERAWMRDELAPISGDGRDAFGGWAATLVDALDTLWIMGMHDELADAVAATATVDFSTSTDSTINIFETTIRYLGGFLGAYDLTGEEVLLRKAIEVGEMLLVAFDTPNHMPSLRWEWEAAARGDAQEASDSALVSELGSLSLEFTRLSQITQDVRWYDAVARITALFAAQQHSTKLPGMWPVSINPRDEVLDEDTWFTLGGMSDSLYEYFPKAYALLGGLEPTYHALYAGSMAASIEHLFYRPMVPGGHDLLVSGNVRAESPTQVSLDPQGQHLGCFAGGMLALGGRLFADAEHVALARKLTDACVWAYNASRWGVMPETFHLVPCESKRECHWDQARWEGSVLAKHGDREGDGARRVIDDLRLAPGFTDVGDRRYILRPEAIESVFILYRVTGDRRLQEAAWHMWTAIAAITETEFANAAISDVTEAGDSVRQDDRMESFWMAETLKYFYLIFSDPDLISLDDYVLNTEAHPLRRPTP